MNKWLQIVAGFATPIVFTLVLFMIGAAADMNTEGPVLLMTVVGLVSFIALCGIMHFIAGWRYFWVGVLSTFGLVLLLIGGCFVVVAFA